MQRLQDILESGDGLFEGFFEWLEGQYDPESGGFYYARSSRNSPRLTPDIESTAQALGIIERCGLAAGLTEEVKGRMIRFFQSKQDPVTGYFYDANPDMRRDEVMVGRALGYSAGSLRKLGAAPLYPLPGAGGSEEAAPDYCRSPAAYHDWLRSISLVNSWRGCDRLCNSAPYLLQMPMEKRETYLQVALSYFAEIQDPDTGLWGEGAPYVRISGTFKLLTFYNRFGIPLPRVPEIYRSLLQILRTERAEDMCYIRNPISLLSSMNMDIAEDEMVEIAEITLWNMARLKRADGGFSRELHRSPPAPNVAQVKPGESYPDMPPPVPLGRGEVEGDMNAGTQAILIRYTLRELSGLPASGLQAAKFSPRLRQIAADE
ncbi:MULTISPECIES: hypothetical protein [Paenibacillus]|jgi:hypothetical protein|uniref:Uncharacterized protein n=1 Tax=Paenibacillus lactis 154 TaxID=743719 RepID=G4HDU3_9BACL|nr:hypothetical protein [Paenibacillus lactis]EHB65012.1 hypothetical protein PaelaDRAFT_2154 [Paenibacillus lactis 154]MCM3495695.1 hypothetical protein [Paenibacillus lactis]